MSEAETPNPIPADPLDAVMAAIGGLGEKLDRGLGGVADRLKEGDDTFKELAGDVAYLRANLRICMRSMQSLLVREAAEHEVQACLREVNAAVREYDDRDTKPPANYVDDDELPPTVR